MTRHWYRRRRSMPRALRLVIVVVIPLQRTELLGNFLLFPAGDELLERPGDRCLLGALTAELQRTLDQLGVDSKIRSHLCVPLHIILHALYRSNMASVAGWGPGGGLYILPIRVH